MIDKTELKKQYKQTAVPMGIYKITNLTNGKFFIGQSKNLPGRINRHKFALKFGSEEIADLQSDFRKYGEENFTFEILDYLKPKDEPGYDYTEDLECLLQLWLEKLQPYNEKGYNTLD